MKRFRVIAVLYMLLVVLWVLQFITNFPSGAVSHYPKAAQTTLRAATSVYVPQVVVTDYPALLIALRANGVGGVPTDKRVSTLFGGSGHVVTITGGEIQIFEYADTSAADAQTAEISPDGGTIHARMISWSAPPHFYKQGKLLVLYVGTDPAIVNILAKLIGTQFAGG